MTKFVEVKHGNAGKVERLTLKKNSSIKVRQADTVKIFAERSEVSSMEQQNNDLVVVFSDGSQLRLEGYFQCSVGNEPQLAIADPVAQQNLDVSLQGGTCGAGGGTAQKLAYSLEPGTDGYVSGFVPLVAAGGLGTGGILGIGAAVVGGGAAAAGGGGGGGGGGGTPPTDQTPPAAPVVAPTNGAVISGTAEAGSSVTLDLDNNGTTDATVPVDSSGNWTYTPATPIADGQTVIVKATDPAGNVSNPTTVVVDRATPTPTITSVTDDVGAITGAVASGGSTDDNRPTIVGSGAEANATVAIFDGATQIGTATANASGNWSFTPDSPLGDGPHSFTARATDALGNVSGNSAAYAITIGADGGSAPGAPVIIAITDDVSPVTGTVANGGATNDTRPAIVGSGAPANATVTVFDGATQIGTTTANTSGNWSFTPASAISEGAHSFTARATGSDGQVSPASASYAITVDVTPPSAPTINPTDGTGLTGTSEPGTTVRLDIDGNGTVDTTVPVNGGGTWSYVPPTPIPDGTTVTATAVDPAGNPSGPATTVVDADIDTPQLPSAPAIVTVTDDIGAITGTVARGGVTDDTRPTIAGTGAGANGTVSVFDGTTLLGTATADAAGAWSFTPAAALGQGAHTFSATVTNAQGTSPLSTSYAVSVDSIAPAAPVIDPTNGNALTGTAEPGTTVRLDIDGNGTVDVTVPANGSGGWTYIPPTPIPNGTTVTAQAVDAAGNTSGPGTAVVNSGSVTPQPPSAPTITAITDDVGAITGTVTAGGTTDDTRPQISGTGAGPNGTVSVYDGTTLLGTAVANASGAWSFTPSAALGEGAHSFTATVTNAQGTSPLSAAYGVTISVPDTTPPLAPSIGAIIDDVGAATGTIPNGGNTDDARPEITGTGAEANATVTIFDGSTQLGTTTANASGVWTFTPASALPTGPHSFTARVTDAAGNVGPASTAYAVTIVPIDTTPPLAPTIGAVIDDVGILTGTVLNGGITDDPHPQITGTGAEANATVTVYDGTTLLGITTANGSGAWSFTPVGALPNGSHSFTATVTDAAGNVGPASNAYAITIALADTTPPGAPTIGQVIDNVGVTTGNVLSGGTTDDALPEITGTGAEAGATVTVYDGTTLLGTTTANLLGGWSFTPTSPLPNGPHSFTATVTDLSGNLGPASGAYTITVAVADTTPPGAPTIVQVIDDVGILTGTVLDGGLTDDPLPEITGNGAEANATVNVYDGATLLGSTTANGAGIWSFTPGTALPNGPHSFTATVTDAAGNEGNASSAYDILIVLADTTPPGAPTIGEVIDNVGATTGVILDGGTTDDPLPEITGTGAEAGATVTVYDGTTLLGTTTAGLLGGWSFTPTSPLPNGPHSFTATVTDLSGNLGPASAAYDITIALADTTPPAAPTIGQVIDDVGAVTGTVLAGGTTDDPLPEITGTGAEANATVNVYDGATLLGTTTANGAGAWSYTPGSALPNGPHSFTATVTDAAGNEGLPSAAYAITIALADTTPPVAPTIGQVIDDVGLLTGTVLNGGLTDDPLPEITGTGAEANATVTVYDGATVLGTTTANGAGVWSYTPGSALPNGPHSFTATVTDAAGNEGLPSNAYSIIILLADTTPPAAPTIGQVVDNVGVTTGVVLDGGTTDDDLPEITGGGAEIGATVTIYDGATLLGTTTANLLGQWSYTPGTALPNGPHSFTATVTDLAGNEGLPSAAYDITIAVADTTPPAAPTITQVIDNIGVTTGNVLNAGTTDDDLPEIRGSGAEANATVTVYDGATELGTTVANGAGVWSYTPGTALPNGPHVFTATVTDTAGNEGLPSAAYTVTVAVPDTTPPTATVAITAIADDTGNPNDFNTEDQSPTIFGTLSAPLGAGEYVEVRIGNSGPWERATVTGNTWFHGPGILGAGSYTINARVIDDAANVGNSANRALTITDANDNPFVLAQSSALLGLIGAEALGIIDLGSQSLTAVDRDGDLTEVRVRYAPLVALGNFRLTASTLLAAELGLNVDFDHDDAILGLLLPQSTLTITAGSGAMTNQAVNELLGTVHFSQADILTPILRLDVLGATTIRATDGGAPVSSSTASLANLSLLDPTPPGYLKAGTTGNDTALTTGTGSNDRIYGFAGDDILTGHGGNDLLRGGDGADSLYGGAGNDVLVYDATDLVIDGGDDFDTLLIDSGTGNVLTLNGSTVINDIERIHLGIADGGRSITLTQAGIASASSGGTLLVTGDQDDSVTLVGGVYQGQELHNNHAYAIYSLGGTFAVVDTSVTTIIG